MLILITAATPPCPPGAGPGTACPVSSAAQGRSTRGPYSPTLLWETPVRCTATAVALRVAA
eukprot:2283102-Pleurochrysis_carterae.AAC.1